jgi:hypothetical protein
VHTNNTKEFSMTVISALSAGTSFATAWFVDPTYFTTGEDLSFFGIGAPDATAPTASMFGLVHTNNDVNVYRFDVFDLPFQTQYPTITFDIDGANAPSGRPFLIRKSNCSIPTVPS